MRVTALVMPLFGSVRGTEYVRNSLHGCVNANDLDGLRNRLEGHCEDLNGVGEWGETPLMLAVSKGYEGCASELLDARADVDKADRDGRTALFWASNAECIEVLLAFNANPNPPPAKYGSTPLHVAALNGRAECVWLLVKAGAALEACNNSRQTPLHAALRYSQVGVCDLLLNAGARMPPESSFPRLAMDLLRKRRNVKTCLRVFIGVLRKRVLFCDESTAHIGNKLPLDVVRLLSLYVWATRRYKEWMK